jgi:uncharacterized protein YjbJ (UPF0337 family)
MNKDTVKGTIDDAAGRAKRQVGEWTGDKNAQVEGAGQQIKGKVEKAWGNVKDAAKDASKNVNKNAGSDTDMERENEAREHQRHEEERKHHEVMGS